MIGATLRGLLLAAAILALPASAAPALANGDGPAPGYGTVVTQAQSTVRTVKIGLNKSVVVDLPRDARDVLVSNPEVANAVIRTNRRIYLTGVKVGQTNIIVFDRAGQQIVSVELEVERDSRTLAAMLKRLVPGSAVDVEIVSDNIVLSGSVRSAADARRAQDIANIFVNGGVNAQAAGGAAGAAGSTSISINSGGERPSSSVVNLLTIEGEDQVHLKVTVAEVNRNTIKQLGINWNTEFSIGDTVFGAITEAVFPINQDVPGNSAGVNWNGGSSADLTIQALEEAGVLRTLAEPTLTAISGEQASFLAGGEFPVPVAGSQDSATGDRTVTVEFKPFGVSLAFVPVVLSEGRISLRVKTEVSELSNEGAVTLNDLTIPALKVRRAETTMELPSGGSMVMGGLLQDDIRQAINGVPGLKSLPILGALFRSRDYLRQETELVIIVTPYLVKPVGRPALSRPDDGFSTSTDANALLLGHLNTIYGGPGNAPTGSYQGHYGYIYE